MKKLKQELAKVKEERNILTKTTVYLAKVKVSKICLMCQVMGVYVKVVFMAGSINLKT